MEGLCQSYNQYLPQATRNLKPSIHQQLVDENNTQISLDLLYRNLEHNNEFVSQIASLRNLKDTGLDEYLPLFHMNLLEKSPEIVNTSYIFQVHD